MKRTFMLIAPTLLLIAVAACTKPAPIERANTGVILMEPPEHPAFVENCRAEYRDSTGLPSVSPRADYYCGCVAELALHITNNYERTTNPSERDTLVSVCMQDAEIVHPTKSVN